MAKSQLLNFTQNLNTVYADFTFSDKLSVVGVSPGAVGSGYTNGTVTFTAAGGATIPSADATKQAQWTMLVQDNRIVGVPTITRQGEYGTTPTVSANAAAPSPSGGTGATFNLKVEVMKDLYTASSNDAVVKAINITNFDGTNARVASIWVTASDGQPTLIGAINVPANSGFNGTAAAVDALGGTLIPSLPYDANGKRVIPLKSGQKLSVSMPAPATGTQVNVVAFIEEY